MLADVWDQYPCIKLCRFLHQRGGRLDTQAKIHTSSLSTGISQIRYNISKLRHIGQGCVYFYPGNSMEHLTDYRRREAAFGGRVLPILVVDRDCRMYVDCPLYSPWEWIPKVISVSPPLQRGFGSRDVLDALEEIANENDRVKQWVTCDLVKSVNDITDEKPRSDMAPLLFIKKLLDRMTRFKKDRTADNPYRQNGSHPVPCRYFDEPVVIIPYRHDGEIITFDTYKEWKSDEERAPADDPSECLPLEFHAPLLGVERYLEERGMTGFDIVNLESLVET